MFCVRFDFSTIDENFILRAYDNEPSEAESEFGDKNRLFYDDVPFPEKKIQYCLKAFDSDNGGLSDAYQETFVPKLRDRSSNFITWLLTISLLSSTVACPNASNNPDCSKYMSVEYVSTLRDLYRFRCENCSRKESIRKNSIFYGLTCDLRSAIRILYGWAKGIDLETMANMLGLERKLVGALYNRAAKISLTCMCMLPGFGVFGGENVVVLIDIYPNLLNSTKSLRKACKPILCISEIESIPQKFWLETLDFLNTDEPDERKKVQSNVINLIQILVKPGSILVLPSYESLPLYEEVSKLREVYPVIKYMDEMFNSFNNQRLASILDTIWKKPLSLCEEAQFYNPDYVDQYLIRYMWNQYTNKDSFIMLIFFIMHETRRQNIDRYIYND
ncbi:uncharacterized protein LOC143199807 [Rhynchophorus ferrugineus]|uniref:uncharacterized protein LOC143199807 n=1 Tax=Rhynchophorus ferrugineus TaxID=354439 RepID=UPI003FCD4696